MSTADINTNLPAMAVKRTFFYSGFELKADGVQNYFQGFYITDKFDPEAGFGLVRTDITQHLGSDPGKVHISTFTPL
jgi:hypothetical protein